MEKLKLIEISPEHAEAIWDYRQEFLNSEENSDGASGLMEALSAEEFIQILAMYRNKETVPKGFVASTSFAFFRESDNCMLGIISIRHELNDALRNFGGHIGYSVRKSERRKGYAAEMLRLALEECKKLGLEKVLITCDKSNVGSQKVIVKNGGVFEKSKVILPHNVQYYWIDL